MKKFLIIMSILTLSLTAYAATGSFPDVETTDTYYDGIEFLFEEGIVNGNNDGTYTPDRILNRAEEMKFVAAGAAKHFGWPEGIFDPYHNSICFDDVPPGEWFTKYICYGKEHNWVVGFENGKKFKPSQDVTFVEGLKITYKGFGLEYTEGEIWYKNAVEHASMHNYIPFTISAFNVGLKRDEMADLVTRIIKDNAGVLDTYLGDRADIVVTYATIEAGEDLSKLEIEEISADGGLIVGDNCTTDDGKDGYVFYVGSSGTNECIAIGDGLPETECIVAADGSCVALEYEEPQPTTHEISIKNMQFMNGSITIAAGDTIIWTNNDSAPHTVDISGSESSGTLNTGDTFQFTFDKAVNYDYVCAFHPSMTGSITVE